MQTPAAPAPAPTRPPPAAMKLPTYQGNEQEEAKAQFAAIIKEAEALVAHSAQRSKEIQAEIKSIQVGAGRRRRRAGWGGGGAGRQRARQLGDCVDGGHCVGGASVGCRHCCHCQSAAGGGHASRQGWLLGMESAAAEVAAGCSGPSRPPPGAGVGAGQLQAWRGRPRSQVHCCWGELSKHCPPCRAAGREGTHRLGHD